MLASGGIETKILSMLRNSASGLGKTVTGVIFRLERASVLFSYSSFSVSWETMKDMSGLGKGKDVLGRDCSAVAGCKLYTSHSRSHPIITQFQFVTEVLSGLLFYEENDKKTVLIQSLVCHGSYSVGTGAV